ncbi:MAG: hypothetical protein JOY70_05475 [Acidisphaera sp.]|nr:hypothetical protein [Acidisphaera sp.]MBV9811817.1 hypothetical protein [Acetobacteraceae bacterium]
MTESRITWVYGHEMREQVIDILIDALNRQGFPELSRRTVLADPAHKAAFLAMLDDCRPLPVIVALKHDIRAGQL